MLSHICNSNKVYLANTSIIIKTCISTCTCNYEFWSEKSSTFLQLQIFIHISQGLITKPERALQENFQKKVGRTRRGITHIKEAIINMPSAPQYPVTVDCIQSKNYRTLSLIHLPSGDKQPYHT